MATTREIYNLPVHEHPLSPSARFYSDLCLGCGVQGPIYGGYICYICYESIFRNGWFHKECAEAPLVIIHPFHPPGHPLLLIKFRPIFLVRCPCYYCGLDIVSPYYGCLICEYRVHLVCGIRPSPPAIENPMCHDHALEFLKKRENQAEVPCEVCKESVDGPSYSCLKCHVYFHVDCVHLSKEINHPCHSIHPLNMVIVSELIPDGDDDVVEKSCRFCSDLPGKICYHCSICNFTMCLGCIKHPPPLVIENSKTHTHPLRLFSSKISFACKVCGVEGFGTKPYICVECDFVVHGDCIGLPRVININRHHHRISFRDHLSQGRFNCGVCQESIIRFCGAYSCLVCPKYAVHSRCALNSYVWDRKELEGIPESSDDIAPYKVVNDNSIIHFSHEKHTLRLYMDVNCLVGEYIRCEACIFPVWFSSIYRCGECPFVLHEKCANLPKKKKLVFDTTPYTLKCAAGTIYCHQCCMLSGGFKYGSSRSIMILDDSIDVRCGSISEPFNHFGHLHPLYFDGIRDHHCDACNKYLRLFQKYMLRCRLCDFNLCLYCATLPDKIWHQSHEHPVTLNCDIGRSGVKKWCDVCEMELDSKKWFYTCFACGVNLHVQCVLGDFSRLKPGMFITEDGKLFKVVINNCNTRPLCSHCHFRCKGSVILKYNGENNVYICSKLCLWRFRLEEEK